MNTFYSLTNPLCQLLDNKNLDFVREDFLKIITGRQIERITFHYLDLNGKLKELKLPISNQIQAERILADGDEWMGPLFLKGWSRPIYLIFMLFPFIRRLF